MNRPTHALAIAALAFGLVGPLAATARAASVTKVDRNTWAMGANVPTYVTMYIYVPDKPATNPPIVVACHSCGTAVSGYVNSISTIQSKANANGFILILPEATGRNCWDVGSTTSLKHDGGGDTQALAQMVKYALGKYNGDASRVYVMGGSSGAMMTQAMLAVYPDVFKAGSARAGVPAGCWADGYDPGQQWSNNCAGGRTNKTAQQWGDGVRAMYSSFTGHRPRLQLFHGTTDATINYNNMTEAIEEWTNVLGLRRDAYVDRHAHDADLDVHAAVLEERLQLHGLRNLVREERRALDELRAGRDPRLLRPRQGGWRRSGVGLRG